MAALRRPRPRESAVPETRFRVPSLLAHAVRPWGLAWADLLEFLLPQRCPGCGVAAEPSRLLCPGCFARLPRLDVPVCARCLRDDAPPDACARHAGDRVHAAWVYDERVALLVHALKFEGRPGLAGALVSSIVQAIPERDRRPDLVASVPLHAARRRERGYDQAACLGEALADRLGAPFVRDVLRRVRPTRAQSELGQAARRRNVLGAFAVDRAAWVRGRDVLLVDDVITTGATLAEGLGALRAAGARTRAAALAWAQ